MIIADSEKGNQFLLVPVAKRPGIYGGTVGEVRLTGVGGKTLPFHELMVGMDVLAIYGTCGSPLELKIRQVC